MHIFFIGLANVLCGIARVLEEIQQAKEFERSNNLRTSIRTLERQLMVAKKKLEKEVEEGASRRHAFSPCFVRRRFPMTSKGQEKALGILNTRLLSGSAKPKFVRRHLRRRGQS